MKTLKPVIKVVDEDFARNYTWSQDYHDLREKNKGVTQKNLELIGLEDLEEFAKKENLLLPSTYDYNDILIQNPYNLKEYIELSEFEKRTNERRRDILLDLVRCLGCKHIEIEVESKYIGSRNINFEGEANYKIIKADTKYSYEEVKSKYSYLKIEKSFDGKWSSSGYEDAQAIVKKNNLENDHEFIFLLDSRNPNKPDSNRLLKDSLEIKMSEDFNKKKEIAACLNASALGGLKANYKEAISEVFEVSLKFSIEYS